MPKKLLAIFAAFGLVLSVVGIAGASNQPRQRKKELLREAAESGAGATSQQLLDATQIPEDEEASGDQHGDPDGHLPGSKKNVKLVSRLRLTSTPGGVADVHYFKDYAYVAKWAPTCPNGGVDVVDVSRPSRPKKVGHISAGPHDYVGEGVHAIHMNTRWFKGDVLIVNHESCDAEGLGGISLWDITNPRDPWPLALHQGDFEFSDVFANDVHSVMGFKVDGKAYAVLVDNFEQGSTDVDIMNITNPGRPRLISETGLPDWPDVEVDAHGDLPMHHDMWFKNIGGEPILGVSYWDAGWVFLNVSDPANPAFIYDTNYPESDLLGFSPPEGNAHQGEWSQNSRFWLGTDEDFSPFRSRFDILTGANAGEYEGGEFGWTVPIANNFEGDEASGTAVYGGTGCEEDVNGNGTSDRAEVPDAADYDAQYAEGEERILILTRGVCFFSIKVESGQLKGWDVVLVGNHHAGTSDGAFPDAFLCGSQGHDFDVQASGGCIGHRAMHLIFNDTPEYGPVPYEGADLNDKIGAVGEDVRLASVFDGWGYLNLYNYNTGRHLDAYAPRQTLARRHAFGSGTMSIHEIATDRRRNSNIGYVAWYAVGLVVVKWHGGELHKAGHYRHVAGNDFWGISLEKRGQRRPLIYMSDRDSGLWIFKYTGGE